jgi:filamentous hemagglutinin family protein
MTALNKKIFGMLLTSWTLAGTIAVPASQAQLVPSSDGTWTFTRTSNGDPNQINILGGTQSGRNLFHSFRQFSLQQNQIANFAVNPGVMNILTRVTGGDASIINGTLRVSGSSANLFLMNPAGILFGPNARLNVPAAFTATTANAIGIGENWFNASGINSYAKLAGTPNSFAFLSNPGSIFNAGNLITNPGQSLTLLGGTVINTGTIAAPDGNVTIAAVPGENQVQISQEGSLLSLRLPTESRAAINPPLVAPLSLPALLTGRGAAEATGIVVENGTVRLVGSGMEVQNGDVAVKGFVSGGITTLFGNRNLTLAESQIQSTGNLNLLAGDTVQIRDSAQTPFSILSVGDLKIQGDRGINILSGNHPSKPFQSGKNFSLLSDGPIVTDANFASNREFSILSLMGSPGNFSSASGTTILSNSNVKFGNYTGASLFVQAAGSITGGDIKITTANLNIFSQPTLILRARNSIDSVLRSFLTDSGADISISDQDIANIEIGNIEMVTGGPISIQTIGNIQMNSITSNGGNLEISSGQDLSENYTEGGSIKIFGNINADDRQGSLTNEQLNESRSIILYAPNSSITTRDIFTFRTQASPFLIALFAKGDISTDKVNVSSGLGFGEIRFLSRQGNIDTTRGELRGTQIRLVAFGGKVSTANIVSLTNIGLGAKSNIYTGSMIAGGGGIKIASIEGNIDTSAGELIASRPLSDNSSIDKGITLRAKGSITTSKILAFGGNIILSSSDGFIDTKAGDLTSSPFNIDLQEIPDFRLIKLESSQPIFTKNIVSNGGDIFISSLKTVDTSTGILDSSALIPRPSFSDPSKTVLRGGDIEIQAGESILTGAIDSSANFYTPNTNFFFGGYVTLTTAKSGLGNISIDWINAQGRDAGGDVTISSAQDFSIRGGLIDRNGIFASISTAGRFDLAPINITVRNSFTLGGGNSGGAITTGVTNVILPPRTFTTSYNQNNIAITIDPVNGGGGPMPSVPSKVTESDFPGDGGGGQRTPALPEYPQFAIARLLRNPNNPSVGSEDSASSITGEPSIENNKVNLTLQDSPQRVNDKCESFGWDLQTDEIIKETIIPFYENKLTKPQKQRDNFQTQLTYYNLGVAHFKLGNYKKAIDNFEKSRGLATGADKVNNQQPKARILTNLGAAYNVLGDYPTAIKLHEESLKALRASCDTKFASNQQAQALALRNAGIADLNQENPNSIQEAEKKQKEARELSQKAGDTIGEARALGNLGEIYLKQGNYQRAISYATQELEISRKLIHPDGQRHAFNLLGWAHYGLQNYKEAINNQQEYLRISEQLQDPIGQGQALNNLGDAHSRLGEFAIAEAKLKRAILIWETLRLRIESGDIHQVSFFETQALTYTTLQEVLIAQGTDAKKREALEIAEKGRSRSLVEILARKSQSSLESPSITDIQRIAKEQNATLVEYSIVRNGLDSGSGLQVKESKLQIWVVSPTGQVNFKEVNLMLPEWQHKSLTQRVTTARTSIGAGGPSRSSIELVPLTVAQTESELRSLHQLLIAPIADFLPTDPNAQVVFVPHGQLFLVPFAALQDATGQYLIEKHTLRTAPSIQILQLTREQRQRSKNQSNETLIVGNPTMPSIAVRDGEPIRQLSPLLGAKQEAESIAELFRTRIFTGDQATKAAVLNKIDRARVIHLATHGILNDSPFWDLPGQIALAPLGQDKGWLGASEIIKRDLSAELAVLSACDTGQGKIVEDGVIGLSRSFIAAGVPSVVVSLWSIPDAPTGELMVEFYKNWYTRKLNKAQALREAMLTTMKNHPHPSAWAAFTLIGESD